MLSWGMFIAGLLLLIFVLIRRSKIYYGRQRSSKKSPAKRTLTTLGASRATLHNAPNEILQWQVEMHELARDLKAELDTKMRALQILIRQADEATRRLDDRLRNAS